jgi:hypothetical protein
MKTLVPEQDKTIPLFNTKNINLKSFCYPRNYHKYFSYHLFEGDISEFELEEYRTKPFEQFAAKINEWLAAGKKEVLRERLRLITEFATATEFENFVRIVFLIGRNDFRSQDWMAHEYNYLLNALAYPMKESATLYQDLSKYEQFLERLFGEAEPPAIFDSTLIATLIKTDTVIGLSWDRLAVINRGYLHAYSSQIDKVTRPFWTLYLNCKVHTGNSRDQWADDPLAEAFAVNRFKELTRADDLGSFIRQTQPYSKFFMFNEDMWKFVVDDVSKLHDWATSAPAMDQKDNAYLEFNEFFNLSKTNGFQPVQFTFTYLKPGVWQ